MRGGGGSDLGTGDVRTSEITSNATEVAARLRGPAGGMRPAKVFHLVVEITSSSWRDDLNVKPDVYAAAGVPIYLIGDRHHGEAVVMWRPRSGKYRSVATYAPGETLKLPGDLPAEIPVNVLLQI